MSQHFCNLPIINIQYNTNGYIEQYDTYKAMRAWYVNFHRYISFSEDTVKAILVLYVDCNSVPQGYWLTEKHALSYLVRTHCVYTM